jgi:hypothetical protein
MRAILGMIFGVIFIYIIVNLNNPLSGVVDNVIATDNNTAQSTAASGIAGLSGVVMIVLAAMIILGVVKAMGGYGDSVSVEKEERTVKPVMNVTVKIEKNKKSLVLRIEKASNKLEQYFNNLDGILGIKTVIDNGVNGLFLNGARNFLQICEKDYDWYIADKHPDMNIFKVVGLHKEDRTNNLVYILGNNGEKPYLINIPQTYIEEENIKLCLESAKVS